MLTQLEHLAKSVPPWMILVLGAVMGSIRSVWNFLYSHTIGYLLTKISISITVEDNEHFDAYQWLSLWLEDKLSERGINSLLLRQHPHYEDDRKNNQYALIPHYGTYYMRWRGRPMMVTHWKEEDSKIPGSRKTHSIFFQVWMSRDRSLMLDLLREARQQFEADSPRSVAFHRFSSRDYGWVKTKVPFRTPDSIYMPHILWRDILEDAEFFLAHKRVYADLGTPYRRGYLFEGPPGTGKTTTVVGLASALDLPVYTISLGSPDVSGDTLAHALNECEKPSIVLFEDADCLAVTKSRDAEPNDTLTLSDVLNALDGIGASEDRIVIMTSNHPEKLDPALIRSGRIDRRFHMGYAGDAELRRFYDRMCLLRTIPAWEEFRSRLPEKTTIADAQALAFQGDHALSAR